MRRKTSTATVGGTTRSAVEVLLAENVPNLGKQGEIVRVKPGYARNFLLPQGLATVATDHNKQMVERHRQKQAAHEAERRKSLKQLADAVSKYSVTLEANANKDQQLYGSIVETDISKALVAAGFEITPEMIKLEGPLKQLGMYTIDLRLAPDVEAEVKVWVVPTAGN